MGRAQAIFGLTLLGMLAGLAGSLGGLATRLSMPARSDTALPIPGAAPSSAAPRYLASGAWHALGVQYGIIEVGVEVEPGVLEYSVPWPDNRLWHSHFIANILPPDEAAAFKLIASEAASADMREPLGPIQSITETPPMPRSRRSGSDPDRVLNDAQLASLKARLKLTPDQERMWPAVEAALRKISYAKPAKGGSQAAYFDFDSPEVRQLISAASPLITRLSDNQRREVRSLAHVMGLDVVAASF
jgi:hypothetical protein